MKTRSFLVPFIALATIFILGSCADKLVTEGTSTNSGQTDVEVADPKQVQTPITAAPLEGEERKVVGSYKSMEGVMNIVSCYCNNGGYISTPAGERVAVCFDDAVDVKSCDLITVYGVVSTESIESNGPCPAGSMAILKVDSYEIGQ